MPDITLADIERLRAVADEAEVAFEMDEEAFRAFYERTARVLRAYLARVTGDPQLADDLLQDAYYRLLRARSGYESEAHRRNALFRIATNLARDNHRRARLRMASALDREQGMPGENGGLRNEQSTEIRDALSRLKPRERALLWLAYAHGSSHREIAASLGLKTASVKLLLFRARRRLADLLRGARGDRPGRRP
jgi:RNA polymerase sigma-70 factor (ECF subfamily)